MDLTRTFDGPYGAVRWDVLGDPGAEPVVLLHGTPFSAAIWHEIAPALAVRFRVHVWDMPGYGRSAAYEGQDVSLDAETATFTALLAHWGLAAPRVVAHDSGGAVALGAHLLHGVPYRRLALIDAVSVPPWGSPFFEVVGAHTGVFARLPGELHAAMLRAYVTTAAATALSPALLDTLTAPWLGRDGQAAFYRQLAARGEDPSYVERLLDGYAGMDLPVLVCWGAEDRWIPADRGRDLAARIPGAHLRIVPGAGHLLPLDRPAELATSLYGFLTEPDPHD